MAARKPRPADSSGASVPPTVSANKRTEKASRKAHRVAETPSRGESAPQVSVRQDHPATEGEPGVAFPVVGIGASAGGLEAFTGLLKALSTDTGMAFVFIQHMDPRYKSNLVEILSRATDMPVLQAMDGMRLEGNHVYVMPADMDLVVFHGVLHLMPRPKTQAPHLPVDYFLRSLADDQGRKAIGVVLSGTGSDGALGLKTIRAGGGIVMVQDGKTAKYDGMPQSAIAAGPVDFILSPEDMAEQLARIARHPYVAHEPLPGDDLVIHAPGDLQKIFIMLRSAMGVDFSLYKQSTLLRRISRRMVLHQIETLSHYAKYLRQTPVEVRGLFEDMLITVTGFFREPGAFEALKEKVFPLIMGDRPPGKEIRVWVPGCSTGEEAYSVAISLLEYLVENGLHLPIQVFATDISDRAIGKARAGWYPESIGADISPERLHRFFVKTDSGYEISKSVRDVCVFAKHDVTCDPPFSRLDFISCRNLLIYLGPALHKTVFPAFHYALRPNGFLMLGNSESIGGFSDLFSLVEKEHRIYVRKQAAVVHPVEFRLGNVVEQRLAEEAEPQGALRAEPSLQKEADRLVLSKYGPGGVVVNEHLQILHFRGQTGRYLEPASGKASLDLLKMVRPGLLLDLRIAIDKARKKNVSVRRQGLRVRHNGKSLTVNIEVMPMGSRTEGRHFLVLFEEVPAPASTGKAARSGKSRTGKQTDKATDGELRRLVTELAAAKEAAGVTIEEQEATAEELRAANEEIQSSNEELQSTNEELQTAKEELQSTNEELVTLNEEVANRNDELSQAISSVHNLLSSIDIPIVLLDGKLRIRSFTPPAERVLKVIAGDIGRPIKELTLGIHVPDLQQRILEVISSLNPSTQEIQASDGRWYSLRIRPYKTEENKIDGAVLALVDITERRVAEAQIRRLATVLLDSNDAITVQDLEGVILAWNPGAERMYGWTEAEALGKNMSFLAPKDTLEEAAKVVQGLVRGEVVSPFRTQRVAKGGLVLDIWLTASVLKDGAGKVYAIATTERVIKGRELRTTSVQAHDEPGAPDAPGH